MEVNVNTFKEIKTFVKEHLREVQSEWDNEVSKNLNRFERF